MPERLAALPLFEVAPEGVGERLSDALPLSAPLSEGALEKEGEPLAVRESGGERDALPPLRRGEGLPDGEAEAAAVGAAEGLRITVGEPGALPEAAALLEGLELALGAAEGERAPLTLSRALPLGARGDAVAGRGEGERPADGLPCAVAEAAPEGVCVEEAESPKHDGEGPPEAVAAREESPLGVPATENDAPPDCGADAVAPSGVPDVKTVPLNTALPLTPTDALASGEGESVALALALSDGEDVGLPAREEGDAAKVAETRGEGVPPTEPVGRSLVGVLRGEAEDAGLCEGAGEEEALKVPRPERVACAEPLLEALPAPL